jgi:hypothetical protein
MKEQDVYKTATQGWMGTVYAFFVAACAHTPFSEADFNSQNGDSALGVCYRRTGFSCAFFL